MTALRTRPDTVSMSVVRDMIEAEKRGAEMSAVTLNTARTTRPHGLDGAVFRLGLALVVWSRSREARRPSLREQLESDRLRAEAWRRRDDDRALAMSRTQVTRYI
jgi:hypothetical protein